MASPLGSNVTVQLPSLHSHFYLRQIFFGMLVSIAIKRPSRMSTVMLLLHLCRKFTRQSSASGSSQGLIIDCTAITPSSNHHVVHLNSSVHHRFILQMISYAIVVNIGSSYKFAHEMLNLSHVCLFITNITNIYMITIYFNHVNLESLIIIPLFPIINFSNDCQHSSKAIHTKYMIFFNVNFQLLLYQPCHFLQLQIVCWNSRCT